MRRLIFLFFLFNLIIELSFASQRFPKPKGYINDFANIIPSNYIRFLERLAWEIEKKAAIQIAVVTVKSLKGESIENFSVALFEDWGIGKKGRDEGLLILVAPKERRVRIEVGYGLEGVFPDSLCGKIIDEVIIPFFKKGDYGKGIVAAMSYIAKIIEKEYQVNITMDSSQRDILPKKQALVRRGSLLGSLFTLLLFMLLLGSRTGLLGFFLLGFLGGGGYWRTGGYYRGSGGFSGGFGGFGGGLSGGGGASGSW
jgi:uncharacterized protein